MTDLQRRIAGVEREHISRPADAGQIATALGISVETAGHELDAMAGLFRSEVTHRQRQVALAYNGGYRTTQASVAEELEISRMTVARDLKAMRDAFKDADLRLVVLTVSPALIFQIEAKTSYLPADYMSVQAGQISRATAYRRAAKAQGTSPQQVDPVLYELKIARWAFNRAVTQLEAAEGKMSHAAQLEMKQVAELFDRALPIA